MRRRFLSWASPTDDSRPALNGGIGDSGDLSVQRALPSGSSSGGGRGRRIGIGCPDDPSNQMLSVRQVAALLQVSTRTVWRLLSAGTLPSPVRLGGCVRWRVDDIAGWIDAGCPRQRRT